MVLGEGGGVGYLGRAVTHSLPREDMMDMRMTAKASENSQGVGGDLGEFYHRSQESWDLRRGRLRTGSSTTFFLVWLDILNL